MMAFESVKILLTGLPGCGKTTAVMQIVENLDSKKVAGFYTREIRRNNKRKGFSWASLHGAQGILAHVDIKGRKKVGKYGVDVEAFEKAVVPILDTEQSEADLFIMDEIGKMECLSKKFIAAVRQLFTSERSVLATVALKGSGLISEVKHYPDARLFKLTQQNHDRTVAEVLQLLSFLKKPS